MPDHTRKAREFLKVAHLYRLGHLPTEQPHPDTRDLSLWARTDLRRAIATLQGVDLAALRKLESHAGEIDALSKSIQETFAGGGRVFLCGCGATGRLVLTVESLWRSRHQEDDRVVSFMAGGDVALVHALERFEDEGTWGARHLRELGFADGDLLIACTEGGETPYVLGAIEKAAQVSSMRSWLLFCNPEGALDPGIERFRRVRENPLIRRICLDVGPMALAGSTRMQASTVLQLALGLALLHPDEPASKILRRYRERMEETDLAFLAGFIERESAIYESGDCVSYRVRDYGITVFTDTTERAPTFSLIPFDQLKTPQPEHSLCYIALDDAATAEDAWRLLLNRAPRPLEWPEVDPRTSADYLQNFDFSVRALNRRRLFVRASAHHEFSIVGARSGIALSFGRVEHVLPVADLPDLLRHTLLKQALNIHSTLVMGRLGRYQGNLMTWVRPTNGKLVDRSARYVQHLLVRAGCRDVRYEEIVLQIFAELERGKPNEPVVLKTVRSLKEAVKRPQRQSRPLPSSSDAGPAPRRPFKSP